MAATIVYSMISLDNIGVDFGGFELLRDVNILINPQDRIGLIGKNGAGKTTLLKLISGDQDSTTGAVNLPKDTTIGYLPQEMRLNDCRTLKQETIQAFDELLSIEKKIERLNQEIGQSHDYHSQEYLKKLDTVTELNERYAILGGDNYIAEMEQTLIGLGFERSDFERPTSEFSGGWRMRIELAKILLKQPDIILLDEPTNHLDIESIQWLEEFLINYKGAVILVSHDKAFLNTVTNRTIEISMGRVSDQKMNFSAFVSWKKEQREIQLASYQNQQKMIEDTERFIERFRYKATKAVQVQSRIKQLEKLDRIEVEEEDSATLKINFPPAPRSGKVVVEGKNITKNYANHKVLNDIHLTIESGDKIAFVGRNGEGKTTLVNIIMQNIDFEGSLKTGHNVKIGYFAQNQAQLLNEEQTVFETIDEIAVGDVRTKIRDILGAFLFSGEDSNKKVKVLSGGEKSRLAMIRLMLEPVNFLVLDEPTNHLDMRSKEILKTALNNFSGTVLVVSHDREFLDGLVECVYEFRNKKIKQHLGGIYDFLRRKKLENLKQLETRKQNTSSKKEIVKINTNTNRPNYEERKEINRNISKYGKLVEKAESEIEKLENEIENMDKTMESEEVLTDNDFFDKYNKHKEQLKNAMENWEEYHTELENWQTKKNW